jgi:hypothetical protein
MHRTAIENWNARGSNAEEKLGVQFFDRIHDMQMTHWKCMTEEEIAAEIRKPPPKGRGKNGEELDEEDEGAVKKVSRTAWERLTRAAQ